MSNENINMGQDNNLGADNTPNQTSGSQSKKLLIIAGVALVAIIIAGVAYGVRYNTKVNESSNNTEVSNEAVENGVKDSNSTTAVVPVDGAVDDTSGWETYSDPDNMYYMKHPKTWVFQGSSNTGLGLANSFTPGDVIKSHEQKYGNNSIVLMSVYTIASKDNPKDWHVNQGFVVSESKELFINGHTAYYTKEINNSYTDHGYTIDAGDNIIYFIFREKSNNVDGVDTYTQYLSDFEAIVNSIRFLDSASIVDKEVADIVGGNGDNTTVAPVNGTMDDTSDWQTYTNTEFGFELKYPGDWSYVEGGGVNYTSAKVELRSKLNSGTDFYGNKTPADIVIEYFDDLTQLPHYQSGINNINDYTAQSGSAKLMYNITSYKNINGILVYSFTEAGLKSIYTELIPHNNHYYQISFTTRETGDQLSTQEKDFQKSFKFTK